MSAFSGICKSEEVTLSNWVFTQIFEEGALGVSFFFVLSGFILSHRYHEKFLDKKQQKSSFYLARISRIYPLHILCFIISIPLVILDYDGNLIKLILTGIFNLTLTQSFIPYTSVYFSFNLPSWSLSNEIFFYLLFPFLTIWLKPQYCKKNAIIAITISILLFSLLFIIPKNLSHQLFYINPIIRLYDFSMGIILFGFYKHIKNKGTKLGTLFELLSVSLFVILFAFHNQAPSMLVNSLYYMIPICLIILSISLEQGRLSYLLRNFFLVKLGEISFAFYMIHQLIIRYYLKSVSTPLLKYYFIDILLIFIISAILSYLIYYHIELKSKNIIRNHYLRSR